VKHPAIAAKQSKHDYSWIMKYDGKSTNLLMWENRNNNKFDELLKRVTPKKTVALVDYTPWPLINTLETVLGGPPDDVKVLDKRYVYLAACRAHSATEKGFVGIDTVEDKSLVGVIHYLFNSHKLEEKPMLYLSSNSYSIYAEVPDKMKQLVKHWLKVEDANSAQSYGPAMTPTVVRFDGAKGIEQIKL